MKRKKFLSCAAAVLFCLLAGSVMWAQSDQPSLADIARQKHAAKAKKVVTNDEIPPSPEANNPPPSSDASASAGETGSAPGAKTNANKDAAKAAISPDKQARLQELMKESDNLRKIIKQMEDKIAATNDPNRIATLSDVLKHAQEALAENEREIDKLKAGGATGGTQATTNPPVTTATPPK